MPCSEWGGHDRAAGVKTPLRALPSDAGECLRAMAGGFDIPGLCVVLADANGAATMLYGEDARGSGRPVAENTWFHAASSGKHVTACVVLDLASRGRIDLAAPIGAYLAAAPPAWADRGIASLLHHTSGLPEYLTSSDDAVPATRAGFMARVAPLAPVFDTDTAWGYSNTNYILLGLLCAEVSGQPCGEQMAELFARVGAGGACAASPAWVRTANAAALGPSARDADSLAREVIGDGDAAFTAAGAAAWLRALVDGTVLDAAGLTEFYAPARLEHGFAPYGCGLFLEHVGERRIVHHAGHFDGWTAMLLVNLDTKSGVFALCNLAPGSTRAARAIAAQALEDFAPGSTPLALAPIADREPAFTALARRQLIRPAAPPDPDAFAPALQAAIDRGGARGVPNLWSGEEPAAFALVSEREEPGRTMRRYRLTYAARTEHVSVGMTADRRIDWAWPL